MDLGVFGVTIRVLVLLFSLAGWIFHNAIKKHHEIGVDPYLTHIKVVSK